MGNRPARIWGYVAIVAAVTLGASAVIQILSITPLWSAEGAAWVQAVGAVAAIFFALRIADRDSLERRRDRENLTMYASAQLVGEVEILLVRVRRARMAVVDQGGAPAPQFRSAISQLIALDWPPEKFSLLNPLPEQCGLNLVYANSQVERIRFRLEEYQERGERVNDGVINIQNQSLGEIEDLLTKVINVMCDWSGRPVKANTV